jgi:hypothetical protein
VRGPYDGGDLAEVEVDDGVGEVLNVGVPASLPSPSRGAAGEPEAESGSAAAARSGWWCAWSGG